MQRAVWFNSSWHHIAIAYDPSQSMPNMIFYVNASVDSEYYSFYSPSYANTDLRIGGYQDRYFGGMIDEVRYWNTWRSTSQIKSAWNRVLNETECAMPELIGYWHFDEGVGDISQDHSSQSNNAILAAAPYSPSWIGSGAPIIPEFPSFMIVPLFMSAALLAVAFNRRKRKKD
jgi:hypothetical protein